jgi:hypothetical protein
VEDALWSGVSAVGETEELAEAEGMEVADAVALAVTETSLVAENVLLSEVV